MSRIKWARTSQFNWLWDNMGGSPSYQPVCGLLEGYSTTVDGDGKVVITSPFPGGGKVAYIRGVWKTTAVFPYNGLWAIPESGDLFNYYTGGSFQNAGSTTTITLGTSLTPGTAVQVYYFYNLESPCIKYEGMNNHPCPRKAYRSASDYSYDYAPDRLMDLIRILHTAGLWRNINYTSHIQFLWNKWYQQSASRTSPLLNDNFERTLWDHGPHPIYKDATTGQSGFATFDLLVYPGDEDNYINLEDPRALRVILAPYSTSGFQAWWGFGLNWDLGISPFNSVNQVSFKLRSARNKTNVFHLSKVGTSNATLIIEDQEASTNPYPFVVQIDAGGALGVATYRWSKDGGGSWVATGLVTCAKANKAHLIDDIYIWWETYGTPNFVLNDYWTFKTLEAENYPQKLLLKLNDSKLTDTDPWAESHNFYHGLPDRYENLTEITIPFAQIWRRDNIVYDGDRRRCNTGLWYAAGSPGDNLMIATEREETQIISGETFYTQFKIEVSVNPVVTAWGCWFGINTSEVNSTGKTNVNAAVYPEVSGGGTQTIRMKVKDANGSYFYTDFSCTKNAWNRITATLASMTLESGSSPMVHPIQIVDLGVPSSPPANMILYATDIKFDSHITFAGPNLRLAEFKYIESQIALDPPAWWIDNFSLNLTASDAYPYTPRLALSITPLGANFYRGPTLIHYVDPLAAYLVNEATIKTTCAQMHTAAQDEFYNRYAGIKGPIVPVHTRNDIENVADLGCENFTRFTWWPKYRNYGKVRGVWLFNGALTDASGQGHHLAWQGSSPTYIAGICQPGNTALQFPGIGTEYAEYNPGTDFLLGAEDFTLEVVAKFTNLGAAETLLGVWNPTGNQRSWVIGKSAADKLFLSYSTDGSGLTTVAGTQTLAAGSHYHLVVTRTNGTIYFYVNGQAGGNYAIGSATLFASTGKFRLGRTEGTWPGYLNGTIDYAAVHKGRAMGAVEVADRWQIIQGALNGSTYPEVGNDLGQYWAFMRLAAYYFFTGDSAAWTVLNNWLTWINTYGAADGSGWKFPHSFSEYGFTYGSYDAGAAASIAIGCLYIYMKNQDSRANTWARRILDDLRVNRQSGTYPYLYVSDLHHGWMNGLVAHAFGLAITGRPGQTYTFTSTANDLTHFNNMYSKFMTMAGNSKPNVLNADLVPFSIVENADSWAYAPNYMTNKECGSVEALVIFMDVALDKAKQNSDWTWFDSLLDFILLDNLTALAESSIESISLETDLTLQANRIRVIFGEFMQDKSFYKEEKNQTLIDAVGEIPKEIDLRYGQAVITESGETAQLLATRALAFYSKPWESVTVTAWLEALRIELADTVGLTSSFHNLTNQEFFLFSRLRDFNRKRIRLITARQKEWKT